jgi:hypothetical protein
MPKKSRHRKGFILRKKGTRKFRGGLVSNPDFTTNTTTAFVSAQARANTGDNQACKVEILNRISGSNAYINRLVYLSTKDLVLSMIREIRTPPFKELLKSVLIKSAPTQLTTLATGAESTKDAEGVAVSLQSFIAKFEGETAQLDGNTISSINKKEYKMLMDRIKLVYALFLNIQSKPKKLSGNNTSNEQNWGNIHTAIKAAEGGFAINDEKTITDIIGPIKATDDNKRNEAFALPKIGGSITKEKVDDITKMVECQVYPFEHKNLGIRTIIGFFDEITINFFRLHLRLVQSLDNFIISEFTLLKHIAGLGAEAAVGLSTEPVSGLGAEPIAGSAKKGTEPVVHAKKSDTVKSLAGRNARRGLNDVLASGSESDNGVGPYHNNEVHLDNQTSPPIKVSTYKSSLINAMNAANIDERKRRDTLKTLISEFGVSEDNSESFMNANDRIDEPNKENYNKELEKLKSELDLFIRKLTQTTNIGTFSNRFKSVGKQKKSPVKDVFRSSGDELKNTIIALLSNKVRALFISNMNPTQSRETYTHILSIPDDKFEINLTPNATDNPHIKELKECAYTVYIASGKDIILTRMALNRPILSHKPPSGLPPSDRGQFAVKAAIAKVKQTPKSAIGASTNDEQDTY